MTGLRGRAVAWLVGSILLVSTAAAGTAISPDAADALDGTVVTQGVVPSTPTAAAPTAAAPISAAPTPVAPITAEPISAAPTAASSDEPDAGTEDEHALASSVGAQTARLAGSDRYGSAVAISRHRFANPAGASAVYLARGDDFSDALTAGTLRDGPVLLTRGGCGTVPGGVLTEIERLDPARVIALGGRQAVCDEALTAAAQGRTTSRIGGASRAETAALIAARAFPQGASRVYLTRGQVSPDAVAGGSLTDGPILLLSADGRSVPAETRAAINALGPSRVVALGGTSAVTDAALGAAAQGRATGRLAGPDRYATAVAIARHAYPNRTARVYLARGDGTNFVDAVAAGMLTDGPVLLTRGSCEPVAGRTARFLTERHPGTVVALGGTGALCRSTLRGAALDARPTPDCSKTSCVALTFDDGPVAGTSTLLDIFAAERVPATFFAVGHKIASRPQVARATAIEGHQIGNHTHDHVRLTELSLSGQRAQLDRTDTVLASLGLPKTTTMRPPFLAHDANTRRTGRSVIMTDTNPKDWQGHSAAYIRSFIRNNVRPGSIVIQHDTMPNTISAMPGIISDLKAAGYTIVTVDELIPNLRPGDLVYNRSTVYPLSVDVAAEDPVTLDDGRVLEPLLDGTGE